MHTAEDLHAIAADSWAHVTPTARKRGRNPRYPYVPLLVHEPTEANPRGYETQIWARAFAERADAVEYARRHVARAIDRLAEDLARPNHRALREQYGLPRDLPPA